MDKQNPAHFGRHQRKIAPIEIGSPWSLEEYERLTAGARSKAASQNLHAIGYGALAESEWAAAGLPARRPRRSLPKPAATAYR